LNLQAHPETIVDTADGSHPVTARAATGDERARLWAEMRARTASLDAYAARRPTETAVVVFEPRPGI
jgi:hypothetical protein